MTDILDYYARRAGEYDRIYDKPDRQDDLRHLTALLTEWLGGRDVLEVACGTGYWTAALAPHAKSIWATDAVGEVLDLARERCGRFDNVRFAQADAYHVGQVSSLSRPKSGQVENLPYDGALAAFFWSHVKKQDLPRFLGSLHEAVAPGAHIALCDSRYVAGSSTPLCRTDCDGNSYQQRTLDDGSTFEVLKNFPSAGEVRRVLSDADVRELEVCELRYFWCARYALGAAGSRS